MPILVVILLAVIAYDVFLSYPKIDLTSIAIFVTAIGTLITVQEMKKERVLRVRPNLHFKVLSLPFSVDSNHFATFSEMRNITVRNVGLGPLIKMKYEWIGHNDFLIEVNKAAKMRNIEWEYNKNGLFLVGGPPDSAFSIFPRELDESFLEPKCNSVILTDATMHLYASYLSIIGNKTEDIKEIPIELKYSYEDIYGNKYRGTERFVYTMDYMFYNKREGKLTIRTKKKDKIFSPYLLKLRELWNKIYFKK